jgi:replication initiation protein RepC
MTYQFKSIANCGVMPLPQRDACTHKSLLKLRHSGLPDGVKPLEITDLLEPLRAQLKLSDKDITYMRLMMRKLRREDFLPGRICAVWQSVTKLADELAMLPRQIHRIEQRLVQAGLITKTSNGNGSRFGQRRADGVIEFAAGINFAPLINRMPEILAYHRAKNISVQQLQEGRHSASLLISEIRALKTDEAIEAARTALPRLRPSEINDLRKLEAVIDALRAVLTDFSSDAGQQIEVAQSDSLDRPYTKTINNTKTCTTAQKEKSARRKVKTTPAQVRLLATIEFAEIMGMYLDGMEPGQPLSWRVIGAAARDFAQMQGVSGADWANCCNQLGEERASLCLLLADRNSQRLDGYRVRDVASAFIGMVRAEARGKAVIEALIAELS